VGQQKISLEIINKRLTLQWQAVLLLFFIREESPDTIEQYSG